MEVGLVNGGKDARTAGWRDGQMNGWMDEGCREGGINGRMEEGRDEWTDGWTE